MSVFAQVVAWFLDGSHWTGYAGVPVRVLEHLEYSTLAVLVGIVVAVPLGALVGHTGRGGFLLVGLANGLRALPDLGLLVLLVLLTSIGLVPVIVALAVLAIPPLLAGTYSGVRNVDRTVVDAARGMGMRESGVLLRVELPNALPLMIGGLRSAMLQVIATTAIAAYVGFGGLGRLLFDGLSVRDYAQMAAGALLVAALALVVEAALAGMQRLVVSPGLRDAGRRVRMPIGPKNDPPASRRQPSPEMAGANT